jgi:uncharacterized protein (DUF1778 family)
MNDDSEIAVRTFSASSVRALGVGARREDHELLAAVARAQVAAAHRAVQDLRDPQQDLVAGRVAEPVVQALEVVDVDHEDRERLLRALDAPDLAREVVLEEAVVVQPREPVGDRELVQHFVRLLEAVVAVLEVRLVSSISSRCARCCWIMSLNVRVSRPISSRDDLGHLERRRGPCITRRTASERCPIGRTTRAVMR